MSGQARMRDCVRVHVQHARLYDDGELVQRLKQADAETARLREELDLVKACRDAFVDEFARREREVDECAQLSRLASQYAARKPLGLDHIHVKRSHRAT